MADATAPRSGFYEGRVAARKRMIYMMMGCREVVRRTTIISNPGHRSGAKVSGDRHPPTGKAPAGRRLQDEVVVWLRPRGDA